MSKKKNGRKRARNNEGSVNRRADGRWQISLSVGRKPDGSPKRRTWYAATEQQAHDRRRELAYQFSKGELQPNDPAPFKVVAEGWLAFKKADVQERTHNSYAQILKSHVLPSLGNMQVAKISRATIESLLIDLNAQGLGHKSRTLALWLTKSVLKRALDHGLLKTSPAAEVSMPKRKTRFEADTWTRDEAARFLEAARKERLFAAFCLLLACGLRRGELLGLKWRSVDLVNGEIKVKEALRKRSGGGVEFAEPKTKTSRRTLYIGQDVVGALCAHRDCQNVERTHAAELWHDIDLVFATAIGTPIHPDNLKRVLKRICAKATVPVIRVHDLRHTYASLALRGMVDDKVLSERLGHTDVAFTRSTYQHTCEDQHRSAALSMELLIGLRPDGQLLSN